MTRICATIVAVTLCLAPCFAATAVDRFTAEAEGSGRAVLWFLGQEVTADVRATVTVSGVLSVGSTAIAFTAQAAAVGSGTGNTNTLAVDAWVAVRGEGKTEAGVPVTLEGGISVDALDSATTSSGGQGMGHFYLLVSTPDGRWIAEGDAVGSATGSFVVPKDPLTMELEGTGSFTLSGTARVWTPPSGALFPEWPAELLAELARQAALAATESGK